MSRPSLTPPDSPLALPPPPPSRRIWKRDKGTGRFKWIERACSGEVKASSTQIGEDLTLSLADAIKVDEGAAQHQPPRQRPVPKSEKKSASTPFSLLNLPPPPFGPPKSEKKREPYLPNLPPPPLGPPPSTAEEIETIKTKTTRIEAETAELWGQVDRLSAELNASKSASDELRSQAEAANNSTWDKSKHGLGRQCSEEDRTIYHTVKPGESFQFICLKYKVSANALREANNISGSTLKPSQRLIIPSPTTTIKGEEFKVDKLFSDALLYCRRHQHKKKEDLSPEQRELIEAVDSISSPAAPKKPASVIISKRSDEEKVQYHEVQPDDSLRWICLRYKVNANEIRRANNFTGSNLKLAPQKLIIPKSSRSTAMLNNMNSPRATRRSMRGTIVSSGTVRSSAREDDLVSLASMFSAGTEYAEQSTVADDAPVTTVYAPPRLYSGADSDSSDTEEEQDLADISSSKTSEVRYHDVRPTDTIEYLCMKFRVSAPALRRANIGLTGRNLQTGPKRLIIPPRRRQSVATTSCSVLNTSFVKKSSVETQDTESVTTFTTYSSFTFNDDETNTIALSDCFSVGTSTVTDQISSLDIHDSEDLDEETLYHDVQPNDTLQGVCLLYGISARELRRANNFRGLNLNQAPERLVIPRNKRDRSKKDFASMTENEKVQTLMAHLPVSRRTKKPLLSYDQARQYLKTNNWNFNQTLRNMQVDMVGLLPSSTKQVRMATRRVR